MLVGSNARIKFGDKRGPRIPVMLLIHQPCRGRLSELAKTANRGSLSRQGELRLGTLILSISLIWEINMRPDMAKVIVERPRFGGTERKRHLGGRNADLEDLPFKESMKVAYANRKELSDNLAPLKRYLQKQIGRPWETVYSEICKRLRNDSAIQKHVKDHIFNFVEIHAVIIDGYPHHKQSWGGSSLRRLRKGDMYIDPKTRHLLMVTKEFKEHKTTSPIIDAMVTRLHYLGVNHLPWGDETRTILWQIFCAGLEKKR